MKHPLAWMTFSMLALLGAVACNNVVGLDVIYKGLNAPSEDGGTDVGRGQIRPSTIDASVPLSPPVVKEPSLPCNADAGLGSDDGACDDAAGRGCCLQNLGDGFQCLSQASAKSECSLVGTPGVFVACRQSRPDDTCCWTELPNNGRIARYTAECAPEAVACIDDSGCAGPSGSTGTPTTCFTRVCATSRFVIGQCGRAPSCPEDL